MTSFASLDNGGICGPHECLFVFIQGVQTFQLMGMTNMIQVSYKKNIDERFQSVAVVLILWYRKINRQCDERVIQIL